MANAREPGSATESSAWRSGGAVGRSTTTCTASTDSSASVARTGPTGCGRGSTRGRPIQALRADRLERRIQRLISGANLAVDLDPFGNRIDVGPRLDGGGDGGVDVGPLPGGHAAEQSGAEGGALVHGHALERQLENRSDDP